ncbi:gamma-glutamyl-gamma-aminobutyrate hydrolase family protein [Rhodobacteraceae bacterium NNCM2]|nr:gamma-glutamyl-gamma-aminobutyrate hydrolase family protein [Coraliihabitans acroporae]
MSRPIVGVVGNARVLEPCFPVQMVGEHGLHAIADIAGATPLMIPSLPSAVEISAVLDLIDGLVALGARANVHPNRFGEADHPAYEPYDEGRDGVALPLIEACIAKGKPVFGICRGFQEMNVAFGGTLHPEIRDLPGRINHRMPRLENGEIHPDPDVIFADRHDVHLTPGGTVAGWMGRETIRVNSLHGQGVLQPGPRVVVEGVADDTTIEVIRIAEAPSFAIGVQWHAEYDPHTNPVNRVLFEAYGAALTSAQSRGRAA